MRVQRFLLKSFEEKENKPIYTIIVPLGSKFVKAKVLQDGIHLFYETVEIETTSTEFHRYAILNGKESIPANSAFIDILDMIVELPEEQGGQGIIIFPIYKLNE